MSYSRSFIAVAFIGASSLTANPANAVSCRELLSSARLRLELKSIRRDFDKNQFYWDFPSDHLPVPGLVTLSSGEQFSIMTWNTLNKWYLEHIMNGKQGLGISQITRHPDRDLRQLAVLKELIADIDPALFALQEVDSDLLGRLKIWSESQGYGLEIVENPNKKDSPVTLDHGVVIYDRRRLSLRTSDTKIVHFEENRKYIQQLKFESRGGVSFLFTNLHRAYLDHTTLGRYLAEPVTVPRLVVGDFNYDRSEILKLTKAAPDTHVMTKSANDFSHIDTRKTLIDLDHILYSSGLRVTSPSSLSRSAKKLFHLLKADP